MATDVDRQIERSAELLARVSARQVGRRARSAGRRAKRAVKYAVTGVTAIFVIAVGWAILSPIGLMGVLAVAMAMVLAVLLSILFSGERTVPLASLPALDLPALPLATEKWLDGQRRFLPAPAMPLLDRIGARLEGLAPQLERLNPQEPVARDVRAILSGHLPELVTGYQAIPADLRRAERHGHTPESQLVAGLAVIEREIGELTTQLASGNLDSLAAHGRYLELKYQEEAEIGQE